VQAVFQRRKPLKTDGVSRYIWVHLIGTGRQPDENASLNKIVLLSTAMNWQPAGKAFTLGASKYIDEVAKESDIEPFLRQRWRRYWIDERVRKAIVNSFGELRVMNAHLQASLDNTEHYISQPSPRRCPARMSAASLCQAPYTLLTTSSRVSTGTERVQLEERFH
jgi:hypothetical protein